MITQRLLKQTQMENRSRYGFVPFRGGLNLTTPPLLVEDGQLRDAQNFEIGVEDRYKRIVGYERFDGRPRPSEAAYTVVYVTISGSISVGDTVTGASSGESGKVIAIDSDDLGDYLAITRTTGDFQNGEDLQVSGQTEATAESDDLGAAAPTMERDADYQYLAAEDYRDDIGPVPGAGPVRGTFRLGADVFAVRDNSAQTEAVIHKATASGWSAVDLGSEIGFDAGTDAFQEGETVTGGTSGATATVERIVVESGDWSTSDAKGRLIVSGVSGAFQDDETVTGGTSSGSATADGADAAITLLPGGSFRVVRYNFFGGADTRRVYGCDEVNRGFEFDGAVYVPIDTGMDDDTPNFVEAHKHHLFFAFGASVQHSGIGQPYVWEPVLGAAEIAIGDTVTGLRTEYGFQSGGTLAIYSQNTLHMLYGTSSADWQLSRFRDEVGAYPDSIKNVGPTLSVDDRGITTLRSSDRFGNFAAATVSRFIQPYIIARKNRVQGSCVVRDKNQYRVFFADKTALFLTMDGNEARGFMPQQLDHLVTCIESAESDGGEEEIYFGSDDGFVYQMERGTSFDGEPIDALLLTHFINFDSPRLKKRFHSASFELSGLGYSEFAVGIELAYGSIEYHHPRDVSTEAEFVPSRWDEATWDQFFWDGQSVSPIDVRLHGSAENISFAIRINSAKYNPLEFSGVNVRFTPRRYLR